MALGGRPHQRGLAAPWILRIHIGAAQYQLANRINAPRSSGNHQCRFAVPASGGRFGAGREETLHEHRIAVGGRQRQRGLAILVDGVGVRARRQQRFSH